MSNISQISIDFIKASYGDSILISFQDHEGEKRNILIDGGPEEAYSIFDKKKKKWIDGHLKDRLQRIKRSHEHVDLLVLSHIDNDHIGGILQWFSQDVDFHKLIKKVWFNSANLIHEYFNIENINRDLLKSKRKFYSSLKIGVREGIRFEEHIKENKIWDRKIIKTQLTEDLHGLKVTILSPNNFNLNGLLIKWEKSKPSRKLSRSAPDYDIMLSDLIDSNEPFNEDGSKHNASSIATLIESKHHKWMFLADAVPSTIIQSLREQNYSSENPLPVDLLLIAHHGSKSNTNDELLNMIQTDHYVISSDGTRHGHPHKVCLARILKRNPNANIYCTYPRVLQKAFRLEIQDGSTELNLHEIDKPFNYSK